MNAIAEDIGIDRKRRSLEAIVATAVGDGSATPPRMRTSENSN
jgi:hypothetical protein